VSVFDALADVRCWVAWRNESRIAGLPYTRVAYGAGSRRASDDDPATWLIKQEAQQLAASLVNGSGRGIAVELGEVGAGLYLASIELAHCIEAGQPDRLADWAQNLIDQLPSYIEATADGDGVQAFFCCPVAAGRQFIAELGAASDENSVIILEQTVSIKAALSDCFCPVTERAVLRPRPYPIARLEAPELNRLARAILRHAQPQPPGAAPVKPSPVIHDAGAIDPQAITPRGWLLGVTFCRKFLSGLIGDGGVGKTAVRYAQYVAGAAGRKDITGEHVHHRFRSLIVCLEDDIDEVQRRIGAVMLRHKVKPGDIAGWLYYCTPAGLRLLKEDPRRGRIVGELDAELRGAITDLDIDLVAIDPFVKAHGVSENDNQAIDEVCTMLAGLAHEFNCAVDLVSHSRKGNGEPGDAERDRGASAKKDAGRLVRTATVMSEKEADEFGLGQKVRGALVRIDDAKVNLTPKSIAATWFKLIGVPLDNGTPAYPRGDEVQAVERWFPPVQSLSTSLANQILDAIEGGFDGRRYSPAPQAKERAAWLVVQEFCPTWNEKQCQTLIREWIANNVLVITDYADSAGNRHRRKGLSVGTRPGSEWAE
jgi:hypothetical protein